MGPCSAGKSLDRIDNSKGYLPGNCQWATTKQQLDNRRSNMVLEFKGEKHTLSEWARIVGLSVSTLKNRISRYDWPVEMALTIPKDGQYKVVLETLTFQGKTKPLHVWVTLYGLSAKTLRNRLKSGWSIEKALTALGKRSSETSSHKSRRRVYYAWHGMIRRCENPKDGAYHNYGGRGITVCEEWHNFEKFFADMGPCPQGMQIDRIDNSKGYYKGNCRWATQKVNLNNRRGNRVITFGGFTGTITQWAKQLGINPRTLNNRINRGWPLERALTAKY